MTSITATYAYAYQSGDSIIAASHFSIGLKDTIILLSRAFIHIEELNFLNFITLLSKLKSLHLQMSMKFMQ